MGRSLDLVKQDMLDILRGLVKGEKPWPLFLFGEAGVGKSRAALALCDHVPGSYYLTVEQVCGEILDRKDGVTWRYLPEYTLVVVDELATRKSAGDLEYTALKRIADLREDLPAVFVSNVEPAELVDIYDERIASRILCGTVFDLVDEDRRRTG